jgi:hypothetical protein
MCFPLECAIAKLLMTIAYKIIICISNMIYKCFWCIVEVTGTSTNKIYSSTWTYILVGIASQVILVVLAHDMVIDTVTDMIITPLRKYTMLS